MRERIMCLGYWREQVLGPCIAWCYTLWWWLVSWAAKVLTVLSPPCPAIVGWLGGVGKKLWKKTLSWVSPSLPPGLPPLAAGVLLSLCNSFHQNHLQPLLFLFTNLNFSLHVSGILGGFWRKEGSKGAIFSSTVFVRQYHPLVHGYMLVWRIG